MLFARQAENGKVLDDREAFQKMVRISVPH
jgi:hypothetical protein